MSLVIATQNPFATAETFIRQHIRTILPEKVAIVALGSEGDEPFEYPLLRIPRQGPSNVVIRKLDSAIRLALKGYAGAPTRSQEASLLEFLNDHNTKTILAEFGPTGASLRSFCKRNGFRLFVFFHGYDATVMPRSRAVRHAYSLLARDADGVICGSQFFSKKLISLGFPHHKISVIPYGIEVAQFSTADARRDPNLILAVGRLTEKKAPHCSIRAFAKARVSRPNLSMEIIGDGAMRGACEDAISKLGLASAVTLHGAKPHSFVLQRLAEASLFVQHSVTAPNGDQESLGVSLLEAMASGIPVVATLHNGFSETVIDGATGLLTPEWDTDAMAESIVALMSDAKRRSEMGRAARRRVEDQFDSHVIAAKMRALLLTSVQ